MERSRLLAIAAIAAATALGAWLRIRTLGAEDLWVDEALTLAVSSVSYAQLWFAPTDPTPPLYYTLHKLVLGDARGTETVRALACAFGVLAIPAMGWLGWRVAGPAAAAAGAVFIAVAGVPVEYAQEARAYALLLLLVIVSSVALHAAASGSGRAVATLVGLLTAVVYAHFTGFLWAAGVMAALLWVSLAGGWLRLWLRGAVAIGVLTTPALWMAWRVAGNSSSLGDWPGLSGALRDLAEVAFARPPMTGAAVLMVLLAAVALGGLWLAARERRGRVVVAAFLLYPVLLALTGVVQPIWLDRALLIMAVPGLLGLAVATAWLPGFSAVAAGVGTAGVLLASHLVYERAAPRAWDWRGAAERVLEEALPEDAVLTCQHFEYVPLRAYTPDSSAVPFYAALGQGWLADFGAPATQGNPWAAHDDRSGSAAVKVSEIAAGLEGRLFVVRSDHCSAPSRRAMLDDALAAFGQPRTLWQGRKIEVLVVRSE